MPKCKDRITHHKEPVRRRHRALGRKCDTQHERCRFPHGIQPCAFHRVGWPPPAELGTILQFGKRAGGGFTNRVRCGLQIDFEDAPKRGKLKAGGWTSRATIQGRGRKRLRMGSMESSHPVGDTQCFAIAGHLYFQAVTPAKRAKSHCLRYMKVHWHHVVSTD
jgi:hypothetical protein